MREDERIWKIKGLLQDYTRSSSLRHIRDSHSIHKLAVEIVRCIDRSNSIWAKWDGPREPGSGKTLLGLELVFTGNAGRVAGEPAALLSGNRPLVHVLQEAIALDARDRLGVSAAEARRQAQQALQTLLGYLKDHSGADANPPEHVIVFDEAQRAWDADTGLKLMGRQKSEPELFLEIMGRLPWACLVCLVGPGQEINRGEGGLALWGHALADLGGTWTTYASDAALAGPRGVSGLLNRIDGQPFPIVPSTALHLRTNLRAYRNAAHGEWVEALLAGDLVHAAQVAADMSEFVCQGLEVDYVGLCWGNDLIWQEGEWVPRRMRAPRWQISRASEARQYRINSYRVLLTRARAGLAIYVPPGDTEDGSRLPRDFDGAYEALIAAGCAVV